MSTRKKPLRDPFRGMKDDEIPFFDNEMEEEEYREPETWTIITALDRVLNQARKSKLSKEFWETCKNPLDYLRERLELTNMQIVVLALMIEYGESITWKQMGNYLDISRLSMMVYSEEIEELITKRWIYHIIKHELGSSWQGFHLVYGVVTALRHNNPFVPERIDGLNEQQLIDKISNRVKNHQFDRNFEFCYDEDWMVQLIQANPQLPLCRELLQIDDKHAQSLLMMIIYDYANYADTEGEGLDLQTISDLYEADGLFIVNELREGSHILMQRGLIEFKCEDGIAQPEDFVLTQKTKSELLSGYVPQIKQVSKMRHHDRSIKRHAAIKEKAMFYNPSEQEQVQRLVSILSEENLSSVQQRLEDQGMRKGFACLFYGGPGTGKTETVLQIARQTGRDLMQVDIAGLRDKYVGESEKNIKGVFARYRDLCKDSDVMPILFFNEADAIIGKRNEHAERSVDKMDNAIQNIILQEMEDLDGILIATTNLTSNFDNAFERRFLFKVEFHQPGTEVKAKIWRSMLQDLSEDDAQQLAKRYDFSGGQIENIARKHAINYILTGKQSTFEELDGYCRLELLNNKSNHKRVIGFSIQ